MVELKLLTVLEVAEILRVSTDHVYEMVRQGKLPGVVRVGRYIRIQAHELMEWIDGGGEEAA